MVQPNCWTTRLTDTNSGCPRSATVPTPTGPTRTIGSPIDPSLAKATLDWSGDIVFV